MSMSWLSKFRAALATLQIEPVVIPVIERDPAVAALVERCGRLTGEELAGLHRAWRAVDMDPEAEATIWAGQRLACIAAPDADRAADDADWAFRWTLEIPSDGAAYAAHDPLAGPIINAIRAHVMAVAAGDGIPADTAAAMSGPWREAVDPVERAPDAGD